MQELDAAVTSKVETLICDDVTTPELCKQFNIETRVLSDGIAIVSRAIPQKALNASTPKCMRWTGGIEVIVLITRTNGNWRVR